MQKTPDTLRITRQIWTTLQISAYWWPSDRSHSFKSEHVRREWKANVQEEGGKRIGEEEEKEEKKMREQGRKKIRGRGLFISLIMRDRSEAQVHSGMVWVREKTLAGRTAY